MPKPNQLRMPDGLVCEQPQRVAFISRAVRKRTSCGFRLCCRPGRKLVDTEAAFFRFFPHLNPRWGRCGLGSETVAPPLADIRRTCARQSGSLHILGRCQLSLDQAVPIGYWGLVAKKPVKDSRNKPHDAIFKVLLDQPGNISTLFRERLPASVVQALRLETARLVSPNFANTNLGELDADALVQVETVNGHLEWILVLVEHKSWPEKWVAWQLFQYMHAFLEAWRRKFPKANLPPIRALVLYHGKKRWNPSRNFCSLFEGSRSGRSMQGLIDFEFTLVSVRDIPDARLSESPELRVALLVMKHTWRADTLLVAAKEAFLVYRQNLEVLKVFINYVMARLEKPCDFDRLEEMVHDTIPEDTPMFRSIADQFVDKGKLEGQRKGKADTLERLLRRRFKTVSAQSKKLIDEADEAHLDVWLDRVIDADSLEGVLADA